MEATAARLPTTSGESMTTRQLHDSNAKTSSSHSRTYSELSTNTYYHYRQLNAQVQQMRLRIFNEAPIIKDKDGDIECTVHIIQITEKGCLYVDILPDITVLGREYNKDLFVEYNIKGDGPAKISDRIDDIGKLNTTLEGINEALNEKITLATSTAKNDSEKMKYTIDKLKV